MQFRCRRIRDTFIGTCISATILSMAVAGQIAAERLHPFVYWVDDLVSRAFWWSAAFVLGVG